MPCHGECGEGVSSLYSVTSAGGKRIAKEADVFRMICTLLPHAHVLPQVRINQPIYDGDQKIRGHIRVDFWVATRKWDCIIEYNGHSHFGPVRFDNPWLDHQRMMDISARNFHEQRIRDEWLRDFCENRNIDLVEVKVDSLDRVWRRLSQLLYGRHHTQGPHPHF